MCVRVREWVSACLLAYAPVPDVDLDVTTRRRFRFNVLRVRGERAVRSRASDVPFAPEAQRILVVLTKFGN